ncbi:MAG: M20/M25/M40 family metallo-hydrolase [Halorhodospira halophila]|uniref:M20/M25/M40 family metallo-hydrolase n=1 Tax=Halorhodospira TaxID=85108 RepID=UPI001EE84114|nr:MULTISPECIES: M20/M25/M40 family metallo-hydrolase [Halorhodospira]MCC3752003.1 M20/M25/M40 family metallo-hydrolase [Halorhodospira halophila]MCG5526768.1 M20/M25/M40 family metallo-hydrolase [Halorhodospira halophila]MCG5533380.1 M20/M25/M40 family metallo-hydrolase [Halorhodospira sp. 9621]MCG5537783.1 M20/M25/M40 family metallo-hydrolase [Halorhodospira sp. 9622]MCG5542895.1 M20/M25/M40 family metallo-hydrolase [Halorhodospira sp. 9628]
MSQSSKPWTQSMPEEQFQRMRDVLAAPSPVGLEGAMTYGVLKPYFDSFAPADWRVHQFQGHAGIVLDTHPGRDDLFKVMVVGHADKIRMQVRSIGDDGKVWIDSDSFLPGTLIGHEVTLFSEAPENPGAYRRIEGGTIEALGAIHFADEETRTGRKGVKKEQLYLELQVHGENKKKQVEGLGVRPGDPILLNRPIRRGFSPDTFYGAYLDNGLGCFTTAEAAHQIAQAGGARNVRMLFAIASYEEIGRFGSRVLASELRPDALIAVDVDQDYVAAPGVSDKRFQPLTMGAGVTYTVGAVASEQLNAVIQRVASEQEIPVQRDVSGRDTGTDGMAGVLGNVDCTAASLGIPVRNMHTISESGHTGDVLAAIHLVTGTLQALDAQDDGSGRLRDTFRQGHPRLDQAAGLAHPGPTAKGVKDA